MSNQHPLQDSLYLTHTDCQGAPGRAFRIPELALTQDLALVPQSRQRQAAFRVYWLRSTQHSLSLAKTGDLCVDSQLLSPSGREAEGVGSMFCQHQLLGIAEP